MYPIALDLRGRTVVVVGGGRVAERKVRGLLPAGARIVVVAPSAAAELHEASARGELELRLRAFESSDLEGALLVFAATDDPNANGAVVNAARERRILVDDASGSAPSDFATATTHRSGPVTFAVDTGGLSPSFARRLRDELRERFDERYGRAAAALGRAREYVKAVVPATFRAEVMGTLARRSIDELAALTTATLENDVDAIYVALQGGDPNAVPALTPVVCATRASALAMWQTRHVMGTLAQAGIVSTVLQISTTGDRVQDRPLAELGTDSIFVKELEIALRDRRADYAVHSCKDLPSELSPDMHLAAIGLRADPRDAFCSEHYASLDELPPGALVGTSSPRRRALLGALRPDLCFEPIRGNVDTRLRKLRDGEYDAIVLAVAGLERLGLRAKYTLALPVEVMLPAVGQGALAIETRAGDIELSTRIHSIFADPESEIAVRAERAFLRTLRGGCQAPVGAHAAFSLGRLVLNAAIAAPDGSRVIRGSARLEGDRVSAAAAESEAERLALQLLAEGGAALLAAAEDFREPPEAPLAGQLFLLSRTQERPSQIAPALRGAGAEVIEASGSDEAAHALGGRTPSALLFPSSGSVRALGAYLAHLLEKGTRPLVAAMGEQTSAAAREAGFPPDVVATEPGVGAFVQSVTHYLIYRGER